MWTDSTNVNVPLLQVLSIPFAWHHPAVRQDQLVTQDWWGSVQLEDSGIFTDYYLLIILGGIPYQVPTVARSVDLLTSLSCRATKSTRVARL